MSFLHATDHPAARRTIRAALAGVGVLGLAMGLVAAAGAPLLVHVILGNGYDAAIPVLRLLGLLLPLVAISTVLGLYWALPYGHERALLAAILGGGVANISLAAVLVPRMGAVGMAVAAIAAETVVLATLGTLYARSDE